MSMELIENLECGLCGLQAASRTELLTSKYEPGVKMCMYCHHDVENEGEVEEALFMMLHLKMQNDIIPFAPRAAQFQSFHNY